MKVRHLSLLLVLMVALGITPRANAEDTEENSFKAPMRRPILIEPTASSLRVGNKFVFDVLWMGIPVGIGTIEIKEKVSVRGRDAFHVIARAQTNDFLSKIYPVNDEVHSFIDTERLCTLEFRKKLSEGRYRADERIIYDYEKKRGYYESLKNKSKKEFDILDPSQDILSVFFWFRQQPIRAGDVIEVKVNDEDKNWDLKLKILRTQTKKVRGRRPVDTVVVEPLTRLKGVFEKRGSVLVHFTADKRRLPYWVTFKTPYGHILGIFNEEKSMTE